MRRVTANKLFVLCHCFCLSFFGLLGFSACGFSLASLIETAYDMVVVQIYTYIHIYIYTYIHIYIYTYIHIYIYTYIHIYIYTE